MAETVIRYSNDGLSLENVPAIEEITIKAEATSIKGIGSGAYAFFNAKDTIRRVSFEADSQMKTISPYCFYFCRLLSSVDFSSCSKIASIGDYAFSNCESLNSLTLPTTVTTIGSYVFQRSGIASIFIPASVEKFGHHNFFFCESLVSFEIDPNSPMSYLSNHQLTRTKLVSLKLTRFIKDFSGDNFEDVSTIASLSVDINNPYLISKDNVIFTKNMETLLYSAPTKTGTYEVPNGVRLINNCAFYLSSITGVTFPTTLKTINGWSFIKSKLTDLSFPSNVEKIGTQAFDGCSSLLTVTFSEGLNAIGASCFANCNKLERVKLPKSLVVLGGSAFPLSTEIVFAPDSNFYVHNKQFILNKDKTQLIFCITAEQNLSIPVTIKTIVSNAFLRIKTINKLEIPEGCSLNLIQQYAFQESSIAEINFPETLSCIETKAFFQCNKLKSIHLGSELLEIRSQAFIECTSLSLITVSEGALLTIGTEAFYGCCNLNCDDFKGRLNRIDENCFRKCSKLTKVSFSADIVSIGNSAFQDSGLTEVTFLPTQSLTLLPIRCFYNCTKLSTFNIPEGITKIMDEALAYTSIQSVVLPISVTDLSDGCFQYCSSLKTLTIPAGAKLSKIGFGVFYNCLSFENISNSCENFAIENDALFNKAKTELYVLPPESKCKYFSFPTTLQKVGISALQGCHNVEVIFIPSNVTDIMPYAFNECSNLRSINIPITCSNIGEFAFKGCDKIQCGISIENKEIDFRQSLVTKCGLQLTAISDCIVKCFTVNKYNRFNSYSLFFSVLFLVF